MNKKQIDRLKLIKEKLAKQRSACDSVESSMRYQYNDLLNLLEGYFDGEFNSTWQKANRAYVATLTLIDGEYPVLKQTIEREVGGLRRKSVHKELTFNKDGTLTFTRYIGNHKTDLVTRTVLKNNKIQTENVSVLKK